VICAAQYDAQCAECGGKIATGEKMEYLPRSGDWPARTSHAGGCPEPNPKKVRGVNNAQRQDPEDVFALRTCGCGRDWTMPRDSLEARLPSFVCPDCSDKATSALQKAAA